MGGDSAQHTGFRVRELGYSVITAVEVYIRVALSALGLGLRLEGLKSCHFWGDDFRSRV